MDDKKKDEKKPIAPLPSGGAGAKPGLPGLGGAAGAKPGSPSIPTLKDTLKPQVKIKGLQAGLSLVERLKAFKKKDLAFILAGLGVLFMAPLAEHFLMAPESAENGAFKEGWGFRDGANSFGKGGSPYEGGINGLAPGSLAGGGSDVITPLNVRDPSQLVMGPGATQQPPATGAVAAAAPPPPSSDSGKSSSSGGDDWKDALKASASSAARAAAHKAPLPVPKVPLSNGGLRGLGAVSGGGGGSFSLAPISAANVPNRAAASNSLSNVKAAQGFKGVARGLGTGGNLGALENLKRAAGLAGSDLNRSGPAASNLEQAANRDLSGGAPGGGASEVGSGGADKSASQSQSKDAKSTGESLEFLRMKMEQEKAIELKWKMIEQQTMMWPKLQEKMIETMLMKGLVEPIAGIPGSLLGGLGKSIGGGAGWICYPRTPGASAPMSGVADCAPAAQGSTPASTCVQPDGTLMMNGAASQNMVCQKNGSSATGGAGGTNPAAGAGTTGPGAAPGGSAGGPFTVPSSLNISGGTGKSLAQMCGDMIGIVREESTDEGRAAAARRFGTSINSGDQGNMKQLVRNNLLPAARRLAEARDLLYGDGSHIGACTSDGISSDPAAQARTGRFAKEALDEVSRILSTSIRKMNNTEGNTGSASGAAGGDVIGSDTAATRAVKEKLDPDLDLIKSELAATLADTDRYLNAKAAIDPKVTEITGLAASAPVADKLTAAQQAFSEAGRDLPTTGAKLDEAGRTVDQAWSKLQTARTSLAGGTSAGFLASSGSDANKASRIGDDAVRSRLSQYQNQLNGELEYLENRAKIEGSSAQCQANDECRFKMYKAVLGQPSQAGGDNESAQYTLSSNGAVSKCKEKTDGSIRQNTDSIDGIQGRPLNNAAPRIQQKVQQFYTQVAAVAPGPGTGVSADDPVTGRLSDKIPLAADITTKWTEFTAAKTAGDTTAQALQADPSNTTKVENGRKVTACCNATKTDEADTRAPAVACDLPPAGTGTGRSEATNCRDKYIAYRVFHNERQEDRSVLRKIVEGGGQDPCAEGVNSCSGDAGSPGPWRRIHTSIADGNDSPQIKASRMVEALRIKMQRSDALSPLGSAPGGGGTAAPVAK